jgi:hypothetical protein
VVAAWSASSALASNGSYTSVGLGCSTMALDPSGQFLLVPYRKTPGNPADPSSSGSLTAARVTIATGTRSDWTIPDGNDQGEDTMSVAW